MEALSAKGVTDWKAYFKTHPEEAGRIASHVRTLGVNQATLDMLKADSQEQLLANVHRLPGPGMPEQFALDYECLITGGVGRSYEAQGQDLQGRDREFMLRWHVVDSGEPGMLRVLVIQEDVTDQKLAEQALRTVAHKLIAVREEERRRIAGDLHDSLAQELVAMKLAVHDSNYSLAEEHCSRLIQEVREISHGLYPPVLERLGLAIALEQLVRGYEPRVSVVVQYDGVLADAHFPNEIEITFYRIAQEAVSNAVRHGKATQIELELIRGQEQLELSVIDDGGGFDMTDQNNHGLGLLTMRDRITSIGGSLEVSSQPGRTIVRATAPLPQEK